MQPLEVSRDFIFVFWINRRKFQEIYQNVSKKNVLVVLLYFGVLFIIKRVIVLLESIAWLHPTFLTRVFIFGGCILYNAELRQEGSKVKKRTKQRLRVSDVLLVTNELFIWHGCFVILQ